MASAQSLHTSIAFRPSLRCTPATKTSFMGFSPKLFNPIQPHPFPFPSTLVFSRPRNTSHSVTSSNNLKRKCKNSGDVVEDDDAFERLFKQLEEDLKEEDIPVNDSDEEISEEDLVMLEHELNEVLGDDDLILSSNTGVDGSESDTNVDKDDGRDEEDRPVVLKTWQLRRLASALKIGRRKTNIKSLAADVCLDRAFVLQLLREPPPKLLMMSAALSDEPEPVVAMPESRPIDIVPVETQNDDTKAEAKAKLPVHVMRSQWSAQKRLKKNHIATLEKVYQRTKRPTNAMVCSIVHVTNLPRKRVVKWFEDKRAEDGIPDRYVPFRRSSTETVVTH